MGWFWWRRPLAAVREQEAGEQEAGEQDQSHFPLLADHGHAADAAYALPKRDRYLQPSDVRHYLLRAVLRGSHAAPITSPASILDVGCGTGRWATEMARRFPQARVVAVDRVVPPAQEVDPATGRRRPRPENCAFVQGNILEGLPLEDSRFDFVHTRLLAVALPTTRWEEIARELVRVTRPRGWVEWQEGNIFTQNAGPAHQQLNVYANEAMRRRGLDPTAAQRLGEYLRAAGLVNVETRDLILPAGNAAGRLGQMAVREYLAGVSSLRDALVAMGMTSPDAFAALVAGARAEFERYRCYWTLPLAFGQRPS